MARDEMHRKKKAYLKEISFLREKKLAVTRIAKQQEQYN
jgi:hypothetical protein